MKMQGADQFHTESSVRDQMRILAVDDEPFIRELLPMFAAKAGFEDVATAESGDAALLMIEKASDPYDCILLDISMPGMTGIELCRRIRALPGYGRTPIIMLTAMKERQFTDLAFDAGATDFAAKPFDLTELASRLKAAQELNAIREVIASGPVISSHTLPLSRDAQELLHVTIQGRGQYLDQDTFRTYVGHLSHDDVKPATIFAIRIDGWETLKARASNSEYRAALSWTGHALDKALGSTGYVMSYVGNATFMVVSHDTSLTLTHQLEKDVQLAMNERRKLTTTGLPPAFDISIGEASRLGFNNGNGFEKVLQDAVAQLQKRYLSKSKRSGPLRFLGRKIMGG